jgi:C4-dicarboxylate transporter DctM subunit
VIVIGGILGGICTPAEVGTILVTYVLLLSIFLYRMAKPKMLYEAFIEAGYIAGMTLFMVGTSTFLGFMLARDLVAITVVDLMSKISLNATVIVLLVSLVITVLGMILEPPAVIFGFMPSMLPLMAKAHVDPIYFGVLFCVNAGLGCILPPVALNLFVSTQLAGVRYEETIRACVPFMIIMIIDYLLLVMFPVIPLWLPHVLFEYPLP